MAVTKPVIGGDRNAWGDVLNQALTQHDEEIAAAQAAADAAQATADAAATQSGLTAAINGLGASYATVANAERNPAFGAEQNSALAISNGTDPINFGPVNVAPPVLGTPGHKGLDIIAHWYNDAGTTYRLASTGWEGWYDWRWNFPTNTGNGQTAVGYDIQRHPLQGFYQGDNANVLGWQCKWLAECGVNALSLVQNGNGFTRGAGGTAWASTTDPNYWVYQLFNNVENFKSLRWLLWLGDSGTTTALTAQLDEIIWAYENHTGGYTYSEDGKVYGVVFLWDGEAVRGVYDNFVGTGNTRAHFTNLATKFQAIGYDGVVVMARNATTTLVEDATLLTAGVLYLNAGYEADYGGSYGGQFASYASTAPFPTAVGTVPTVLTSYYTVYPHPSNKSLPGTTPALFGKALRRACDSIVKRGQRRLLTIYNVAEWAEAGPGLIPNKQDGFGYLDQIRSLPVYPTG